MSGIHMIVIDLLLCQVIIFDKTDIFYTASCSAYSTITTPSTTTISGNTTESHESLGLISTISVNSSPTGITISTPRIINKVAIPT